ncbi:very short patch repair endonuclease [Edaphobacter sp.]|uniref:very short patch repair endonuclease n=1 Tax=Edaphobacter sp. TaxID=1934404 RepID=UPI002DB6F954|nr:very short patch repair endonuclease [Edaphobacter sp.]HEU5339649.1 very short patch repair endonuclease [Edaphobacter sp.]
MDTVTRSKRSWMMSRIRSKSNLDRIMHSYLKGWHIKHNMYPKLPGSPDALVQPNILVFLDGCFWHSCPTCGRRPKSQHEYWEPKLNANSKRDRKNTRLLRQQGWKVVRIWECAFRSDPQSLLVKLSRLGN